MVDSAFQLPVIRHGKAYDSMETLPVVDVRSGEVRAQLGYANAGMIRRDSRKVAAAHQRLGELGTEELLGICEAASVLFATGELMIEGQAQSPEAYVQAVSATTGIPQALCATNLEKIKGACGQIRATFAGLTRNLAPQALDHGVSVDGLSYIPAARSLGAVLPSNSPGVHSLWIPSLALKVPVYLKPGGSEPWTPYRLRAALLQAGLPAEAISLYPTDHEGSQALLAATERGMVFGQASTVAAYVNNPHVSVHGPGYSKVLVGADCLDSTEDFLDVIAASVLDNGGRSCINASTIVVPYGGRDLALALAERLGPVRARPLDDPQAKLAAFASREAAERMASHIESLRGDGVEDCTAQYGDAVQVADGLAYMRPTVLWCPDNTHVLAKTEFPFPFVSVVEVSREDTLEWMGDTLVLTAITEDEQYRTQLMRSSKADRLNLGLYKTTVVDWTQPHQGTCLSFCTVVVR